MTGSPKTLLIVGAGRLAGPVLDNLAMRFPEHHYILTSRSIERATLRSNLTKYICSQWDVFPTITPLSLDLVQTERTAEVLAHHGPEIVFNATTPFPWWMIAQLPAHLSQAATAAGPGAWLATDAVLPYLLRIAIEQADVHPVFVNACYPDMVNCFLGPGPETALVGIGNISNLIPGLRLTFGQVFGVAPFEVQTRLVCHHHTSLNAPTAGGSLGAPYYLSLSTPSDSLSFDEGSEYPFSELRSRYTRVRGTEGQGVTVGSASTVLATFLLGERKVHHAPGPNGLPGGYPVEIDETGRVALDLPSDLTLADAIGINKSAQQFDGIKHVEPGLALPTPLASSTLKSIAGIDISEVTFDNVFSSAKEVIRRLSSEYDMPLTL